MERLLYRTGLSNCDMLESLMRYGFVLDQRKCIGCHACTVACKTENQVPVGSFRTWVKYVEKGEYPAAQRNFGVMRCNHCENAPCVKICPVNALFTRPDGIVDLDGEKCIGCQSCMQACPYDAIYIHPDHGVAQKCHYCAHRIERGLEPACVIVCPVQAIVPGDLDNPKSEISQLVAMLPSQVRKPEQGTRPKVFYLGADQDAISPGGNSDIPASYLWSEGPAEILQQLMDPAQLPATREVYNVAHAKPWGWHIAAYLWTKSISAGVAMVAGIGLLGRMTSGGSNDILSRVAPVMSLVFLAITTALLIGDLKRPERFWRLILAPNFTSWLVWGGYILMAFGAAVGLWWLLATPYALLLLAVIALGAGTAGYSAFLFAQCEGRDFWQSPLLLPHLLAQAVVAGAGALMMYANFTGSDVPENLDTWLSAGLILHLLMIMGEIAVPHTNRDSALAAAHITTKRRSIFWWLAMGVGIVMPLGLVALVGDAAYGLAGVLALGGLYVYEHLWVEAGQSVALS
jgi:Fe-S-cluster-containing dehydrogenase component/formate-dependent nitrite reductase membrane component NrfD